jgi:hypothetical protein
MANEITLPVGATAEADTCGSCKFFRRMLDNGPSYVMEGFCQIRLPPTQMSRLQIREYRDGDENRDRIKDTDRCDLHRFSGQVYIVQRRIPPLREG